MGFSEVPPFGQTVEERFLGLPLGPKEVNNFSVVLIFQEGVVKMPKGAVSWRGRGQFETQLYGRVIGQGAGEDFTGSD